jgi:hypothetical protein
MKGALWLALAVLLAPACTGHLLPAAPTPTAGEPASGITGRVTIGPACPVIRAGTPCPDLPYQTTLTITDALGERTVAQVKTDEAGTFRLALAPGDYRVVPETKSPGVPPQAQSTPFHLDAGQWLELNVTYDSGIR